MKNQKSISEMKGREFSGTYRPKLKRISQQPRHKIRQLLRSFLPMEVSLNTQADGKETLSYSRS